MPFLPLDNAAGPAGGKRRQGLRKMYLLGGPEEMDLRPNLIQQLRDDLARRLPSVRRLAVSVLQNNAGTNFNCLFIFYFFYNILHLEGRMTSGKSL